MKQTGDFHTHSTYSRWGHGKHTIAEMVEEANKKQLTSLAITDHGPKHILFPISKKHLLAAREQIDELNKTSNTRLYLGVEANLLDENGKIDLTDEQIKLLDILLVGYHKATFAKFVGFFFKHNNSEKQIERNTKAYINLLNRYNVNIITHIQEHIKVNLEPIAKLCAQKGTLIEINNKHLRLTNEDAKILIDSGCKMIVSSDAHCKENIANTSVAMQFIIDNNIPLDRVVNVDKEYIPKR